MRKNAAGRPPTTGRPRIGSSSVTKWPVYQTASPAGSKRSIAATACVGQVVGELVEEPQLLGDQSRRRRLELDHGALVRPGDRAGSAGGGEDQDPAAVPAQLGDRRRVARRAPRVRG